MICPFCSHEEMRVLETRDVDKDSTRRRRECERCEKRFTTYERVEIGLMVIKKNNKKEVFDREKLIGGIRKSLINRPLENEGLEKIVDEIETMLRKRKNKEIPSREIGKMVLTRLKAMDPVAYMRYASVCNEFEDIDSFEREIKTLKGSV